MDVKDLLKKPEKLNEVIGNKVSESLRMEIIEFAGEYQQETKKLKVAQSEKSVIARQFKTAKSNPVEFDKLKKKMKVASDLVSSIEQTLKAITKRTKTLIERYIEDTKVDLPGQFLTYESTYGQPLSYRMVDIHNVQWSEFVKQHTNVSCSYHNPAFAECIADSFGHSTSVLLAQSETEGMIVGGLPITSIHSRLFGENSVSMPYFNYGGPLTLFADVAEHLIEQSNMILNSMQTDQLEIRTTTPGLHHTFSDKKVSMILPLPSNQAALEDQLGAKVRAQCNKAHAFHPTAAFGGIELLDDFYTVFAKNMRDLGTPVYAKFWFASLLRHPDIQSKLVVCYVSNKPVSVGFLIGHMNMLEIPWASTLKNANSMNMNMWMYRQILNYAIEQKYAFFDFGRSTKEAGTYKFKKQWGAQPIPHYWYQFRRDGQQIAEANPDNPKYQLLISLWKKLPIWLTKIIGPWVVKQIP